jgi:glycosyltransferase involved in cell wall biosynthesis
VPPRGSLLPDRHLPGGDHPIRAVLVVVPARNEAARLERCLASIDDAAAVWGGPVTTVVGADACTDDTAGVVRELIRQGMNVHLLEGVWRRPGRVRRALVEHGRSGLLDGAGQVWMASTDADCVVPRRWIADQIELADAGADIVLGEVSLDPADTPDWLCGAFDAHYAARRLDRRHVHAANLGIRLSAYDAAGGWRSSTAIGEEHHLVRSARNRGAAVHWDDAVPVVTSGRTESRVRGGFATVLRRLEPTQVERTA